MSQLGLAQMLCAVSFTRGFGEPDALGGASSGIKNDPNDWAKETGNLHYILDLLLSNINVSLQTVDIVNGLPKVKFE